MVKYHEITMENHHIEASDGLRRDLKVGHCPTIFSSIAAELHCWIKSWQVSALLPTSASEKGPIGRSYQQRGSLTNKNGNLSLIYG
jgi:hypothetical protein